MGQELQQGRYDQLLRRVGGIIGPGSKVSEVLGELFPVLDVESVPLELFLLMRTAVGAGGRSSGATPAMHNRIQLFNPVDSGKLITVTHVAVSANTTQEIHYGTVDAPLATNTSVQRFFDTRLGITAQPTGQIRFGVSAAIAPSVARFHTELNISTFLDSDVGIAVISPGFGFQFTTTVVNTLLRVAFRWKERAAEQSELNL